MYFSKTVFVGASVLMGCWAVIQANPALFRAQDTDLSAAQLASRDQDAPEKKFFVAISPEPCRSASGRTGICRSEANCRARSDTADGRCAFLNVGVCCVVGLSCNSQVTSQEATFVNPDYPNQQSRNVGLCTMTVTARSDVCQLRLDLTEFSLAQPNNEGVCATDYLEVTGGTSTVPRICGENDGQHLYVDVTAGNKVNLNIKTGSVNEQWRIKVTQISCSSADRAPSGCLQYFTSTSGTISSFNYDSSSGTTTRQLADQSYGVCIKQQGGYCDVTYTQASNSDFSLNGDSTPGAINPVIPPIPEVGDACQTDYIIIGGATIVNTANIDVTPTPTTTDRFCGQAFPGANTNIAPYKLNFVSDGSEADVGDINNQGFQLTYTLNPC